MKFDFYYDLAGFSLLVIVGILGLILTMMKAYAGVS